MKYQEHPPLTKSEDSAAGFFYALSAYLLWGALPFYMKLLGHLPTVEVVAHRVIWSVPIAGLLLIVTGRTRDLRNALASPKILMQGVMTAALISLNWCIYVYAVISDQAIQAALGYYINPIFSIFLGAFLLKEKLSAMQWVAVALAFCAVIVLTIHAGNLPFLALGLTVTWGLYALSKRSLPIGPNQGFLLEVLILLGPAIAFVLWLNSTGESHFSANPMLLMGTGIVTAIPLILYANGAKKLRLSTIAIMQYITPTLLFLSAVFVFDEPFTFAHAIAFPLIWIALALFSISLLRSRRHG